MNGNTTSPRKPSEPAPQSLFHPQPPSQARNFTAPVPASHLDHPAYRITPSQIQHLGPRSAQPSAQPQSNFQAYSQNSQAPPPTTFDQFNLPSSSQAPPREELVSPRKQSVSESAKRFVAPRLRQSISYTSPSSSMDGQAQRSETSASSRNRMSEDGNALPRNPRKKSGLSALMSNVLGSPKKMNISLPENPVHLTHVGYDNDTGEFTVRSEPRPQMRSRSLRSGTLCDFTSAQKLILANNLHRVYRRNGSAHLKAMAFPSKSRKRI